MSIRFRKRIKLFPGVHLNLGKKGASFNFGVPGMNITSGANGSYLNTGIPGSGFSKRTQLSSTTANVDDKTEEVSFGKGCLNGILGFTIGFPLLLLSLALAFTALFAPIAFVLDGLSNSEKKIVEFVGVVLFSLILLLLAWIVFRIFYWAVRSIEHLLGINLDVSSHLPRLFRRKKQQDQSIRYSDIYGRGRNDSSLSNPQIKSDFSSEPLKLKPSSNFAPQQEFIPNPDIGWNVAARNYYSEYLGERFVDAAHYIVSVQRCSNSDLQYELNISAGETAKLLKELEKKEIISVASNGRKNVLLLSERDLMLRLQWLARQNLPIYSFPADPIDLSNLDPLFAEIARYVVLNQQGSSSVIQRRFELGYNRANKLVDQLEAAGIVGPALGYRGREVLIQDEMELRDIFSDLGLM